VGARSSLDCGFASVPGHIFPEADDCRGVLVACSLAVGVREGHEAINRYPGLCPSKGVRSIRGGRNSFALILAVLPSLLIFVVPNGAMTNSDSAVSYSDHDPIFIDSDSDFTAENGVVGGSGIEEDPYRIEGWSIVVSEGAAISVSNTTSHFEIVDCALGFDSQSSEPDRPQGIALHSLLHSRVYNVGFDGVLLRGIEMIAVQDVTVEGCNFDSNVGIEVRDYSRLVRILDNVLDSGWVSVYRALRGGIEICDNRIGGGLWISDSQGVSISGNTLEAGMEVAYSQNVTISDNVLSDGTIDLLGDRIEHYTTVDVLGSNSANGLPVLFVKNESGLTLDCAGYGQVICANVSDSCVLGFASPRSEGASYSKAADITIGFCDNLTVSGCVFSHRWCGVSSGHSSNVTVIYCDFVNVTEGVLLGACSDCWVTENEFTEISATGINMGTCERVVVDGNSFLGEEESVYVFNTSNVTIFENIFDTERTSIRFEEARDALVYHNNFMSGLVTMMSLCVNLKFDNGVIGGNYWKMYDVDDSDGDGFGDDPVILGDFQDRYPLVRPLDLGEDGDSSWVLALVGVAGLAAGVAALIVAVLIIRRKRGRSAA